MRGHPTLTLHQFNAMLMYRTNDTQAFMDAVFTRDDDLYIMRKAREIDASGLEKQRKKDLADFRVRLATMKKAQQKAARIKAAKELQELLKVPFISCVADIYSPQWKLTIPKIHQQLQLLRLRRVPDILPNSKYPNKAEKQKGLEEAFKRFQQNPAAYPLPPAPQGAAKGEPVIVDDWVVDEEAEMEV
ncbi:hypothetical protein DFH06DRAFT_1349726 [Mycena polygramma]|nr:hypothetical protein DFH06DRAFT_1349726 [Mycena polygramma]